MGVWDPTPERKKGGLLFLPSSQGRSPVRPPHMGMSIVTRVDWAGP